MPFFSFKRIGPICTGHRQWRSDSHCQLVHGYGRHVEIEFACHELDDRGWVFDFGNLKDVEQWLKDQWDHRVLIAHDDPELVSLTKADRLNLISINVCPESYGPGIEQSAHWVFDHVTEWVNNITDGRVWVDRVRVYEHEKNFAEYVREEKPAMYR